jgi:hypothetical protein
MNNSAIRRLLRAGITTGIVDGLFSGILAQFFYGSTAVRLFQGVAATLLGNGALEGGIRTAAIGLAMHFGVAFGWSTVFLALFAASSGLRAVLSKPGGVVKAAAVFGPAVWMTMSLVVIPWLVHRPPTINSRWFVQLVGHFPFVGLPIVGTIARLKPRAPA